MDIFQFFSCLTKLPIRIDDVAEFLKNRGFADRIYFCPVDIDPRVLWAQLKVHKQTLPYGETFVEYEVQYSQHLSEAQARLACCKELLHILDNDQERASTRESVERLIQEMSIPPQAGISIHANNDRFGVVKALVVLVPRDCLAEFKPAFDSGQITADEVARATGIPVEYARLTLSDFWNDVVERLTSESLQLSR